MSGTTEPDAAIVVNPVPQVEGIVTNTMCQEAQGASSCHSGCDVVGGDICLQPTDTTAKKYVKPYLE